VYEPVTNGVIKLSNFDFSRLAVNVLFCLIGISSGAIQAVAGPMVGYQMSLTVENVLCDTSCGDPLSNGARFFGALSAGQTFVGGFAIDEDILATDGVVNSAPIYNLRMPFGNALYSTAADNMTLWGFRNQYGLGAIAPGFKILNGNIVDLVGGFYGGADVPFVDFYSPPFLPDANHFWAYDGALGASGSLTITRIPEPATLALLVFGLAGIGVQRRLKQ
jgi:hypothetical protein